MLDIKFKGIISVLILIFLPTLVSSSEKFTSKCLLVDSFATSLDKGTPTYYPFIEGWYAKGEVLSLDLELIEHDDHYDFKINLIDTKRQRHMINHTWVGYLPGAEDRFVWKSKHLVSQQEFILREAWGTVHMNPMVLRFQGEDSIFELRPYSGTMMHGTLLQNLDFLETVDNVRSVFSVLKCQNESSFQRLLFKTTELLKFKNEVLEGDETKANVTRGPWQTKSDTVEVANAHCAKFGKMAKFVKQVWFKVANTDNYACVETQ